ncbi:MAG: pseudouridine-5'-phosphate glycosidase [Gemmatimonadaceae bacterium]|jgi:pseudouridine-5'-phosphate glycosidase|nr:pseudouridine-5'-phosphate glycosidase [Gemmatimonadaceae bacterium]
MIRRLPDIDAALAAQHPVVALETSVLAQGLPIPHNATAATAMDRAVRAAGAVPALTAVVRGTPTLGLTDDELARFLARDGVRKIGARDIAPCMVAGADGATTVAASMALAAAGGVRVFATGGIGGVHRGAPFDESGDLLALARTPLIVTCAGAKSILDLPATLERLETLNVPVIGWRTDELPGFFTRTTGLPVPHRADSVAAIARIARAHWGLGLRSALLVVVPPPEATALAQGEVDAAVGRALAEAERTGVRGAALTPFLLGAVVAATEGRSLAANLALLEANAGLAGEIAAALHAIG